jgi:hypothetical protein
LRDTIEVRVTNVEVAIQEAKLLELLGAQAGRLFDGAAEEDDTQQRKHGVGGQHADAKGAD